MSDQAIIFDRDLLRTRRERARPSYAGFDFLEREAADRLAERLEDIRRSFSVAAELGARSGFLGQLIRASGKVGTLIQSDLALGWAKDRAKDGPALVLDEEALPFAEGGLEAVFGTLSLQWVNDLPGTLLQCRRALKPDGLLLMSLFGGQSLHELRDALAEAEIELTSGLSPRVSPMTEVRDLGALLQRAGFALPMVDADTITVTYENAFALMRDLKGMGEANIVVERRRCFSTRALFLRAAEIYQQRYAGPDGRVPATFQLLTLTAWAPADSQPKPLKPGSATQKLGDVLRVTENVESETDDDE